MSLPEEDRLIKIWKQLVYNKAEIINFHDWSSIAFGFAMGNGYTIDMAEEFVDILRSKRLIIE